MATYLQRTPSTLGDRTKWTISMWYKRTSLSNFYLTSCNNSSNYSTFYIAGTQLRYYNYWSGAIQHELKTNRLFRDTNAWYHIVMAWDSTLATANDRFKFYVNGVQETSFATRTNPPQNEGSFFNVAGYNHRVAAEDTTSGGEGLLSHVHFTDGTVYDATAFGEYDANGVWKIKTDVSVTYGTNGFFILKDGNSVTDQSGNSNNFTVGGGTLTKTEDSPSNVFATMNALNNAGTLTLANGNTTISGSGADKGIASTLGFQGGKYYWEAKYTTVDSGVPVMGILDEKSTHPLSASESVTSGSGFWGIFNLTSGGVGIQEDGVHSSRYIDSLYTNGDIAMFAVDADANKIWYGKNGTWFASGNPSSGTNASSTNLTSGVTWFPYVEKRNPTDVESINFGNGYFGTTPVSSAGTNASGIGIFEYDVPTGYTALSTKGLNL